MHIYIEAIILIVDMASVLAALAYGYVGFIGIKKSASVLEKASCALACGIALLFIALLLWPTSPARLGAGSIVFLIAWTVLGILFYRFGTRRTSNKK